MLVSTEMFAISRFFPESNDFFPPFFSTRELRDATVQTPKLLEAPAFDFEPVATNTTRRRKKKEKKKKSTEEDSSSSSSSTIKEDRQRRTRRRSKSKSRRRRNRRRRGTRHWTSDDEDGTYCRECADLCDFHRRNKLDKEAKSRAAASAAAAEATAASASVSVQAGMGGGLRVDHYMFDPSVDPMTEANGYGGGYGRRRRRTGTRALPLGETVSELMRAQLELAENFLSAQRDIYRTYCLSLEEAVQRRAEQEEKERRREKVTSQTNIGATRPAPMEIWVAITVFISLFLHLPCR